MVGNQAAREGLMPDLNVKRGMYTIYIFILYIRDGGEGKGRGVGGGWEGGKVGMGRKEGRVFFGFMGNFDVEINNSYNI